MLDGLSFVVEPGQKIALVGDSGCGKSSVLRLIQRFYDITGGEVSEAAYATTSCNSVMKDLNAHLQTVLLQILIDGQPISALDVSWLRENIGMVSQEAQLFEGSVLNNVRLGNLAARPEDMLEASRAAYVHSFVRKMPQVGIELPVRQGMGF